MLKKSQYFLLGIKCAVLINKSAFYCLRLNVIRAKMFLIIKRHTYNCINYETQ
jgi:formate/nitrite transporter FocA (FNT family)